MAQAGDGLVEVLHRGRDKGIGVLRVNLGRRLANDIAVEERHGLSKRDCADDKGNEKQRVDTSHDEKTEVGLRPVVTNADHDVESRNAGLTC